LSSFFTKAIVNKASKISQKLFDTDGRAIEQREQAADVDPLVRWVYTAFAQFASEEGMALTRREAKILLQHPRLKAMWGQFLHPVIVHNTILVMSRLVRVYAGGGRHTPCVGGQARTMKPKFRDALKDGMARVEAMLNSLNDTRRQMLDQESHKTMLREVLEDKDAYLLDNPKFDKTTPLGFLILRAVHPDRDQIPAEYPQHKELADPSKAARRVRVPAPKVDLEPVQQLLMLRGVGCCPLCECARWAVGVQRRAAQRFPGRGHARRANHHGGGAVQVHQRHGGALEFL